MILTITAITYITLVCWSYGGLLFSLFARFNKEPVSFTPCTIITCFSGLAVLGVLLTGVSLFIPVGSPAAQGVFLLPSIYWCYKKRATFGYIRVTITKSLSGHTLPLLAILLSGILLILVMHSGIINHPDTLNYHATLIDWAETYGAIPGLAHLNINYGTQSSWFIICSFFGFGFTGTTALTFINAAVLIWFMIFAIQRINNSMKGERPVLQAFLWLLLLVFSFWSYTQIRLSATSGSPDFIAALYVWLILYLFVTRPLPATTSLYVLIIFLGFFAITIKLSTLPVVLLALYAWFRYSGSGRRIFYPVLTGLLIIVPYLAKNVISTGYFLFPSPFPDIFNVDWKIPGDTVSLFQKYVTTYARTHVEYDREQILFVMNMDLAGWMPTWWKLRSLADKLILGSVPVLLFLSVFFAKKIFVKANRTYTEALLFCIPGIAFWFIQAPDPRFGFGFLIPVSAILLYLLLNAFAKNIVTKKTWLTLSLLVFSVILFSYTGYRFVNYFTRSNFLQPAGIPFISYKTIECRGIMIHIPAAPECGTVPIPCTHNECNVYFIPRGDDAGDGFKIK